MSTVLTQATRQWRGIIDEYRDRLPVTDATPVISLREGGTPLVRANVVSERTGCDVWLKVEGANPTGSFKDRGMTMAISKAAEDGAKAVICASTGNTSASAAAYAVRAGMVCAVLVPQGKIALGKLSQALAHGARLLQVDGNFDDCLNLARDLSDQYPVALVNSVNPARIEGQKTAAFEIVDQLGERSRHPCAARRQRRQHHRLLAGLPRVRRRRRSAPGVHGCGGSRPPGQHRSCAARWCPSPSTVATAIRIGNPASWQFALDGSRRVRRSDRRCHRPRDPGGVPTAGLAGGRLRRAGFGVRSRRPLEEEGRRAARRWPDGGVHGDRTRTQGPRLGDRRRTAAGHGRRPMPMPPHRCWD